MNLDKKSEKKRLAALSLSLLLLAGCDTGGDSRIAASCPETGPYACRTGDSEPLYTYQWALRYATSFFTRFPDTASGGLDLNVEPVHRQGIKGQGVRVIVVDYGSDLRNEDLLPNADFGMSRNLVAGGNEPYSVTGDAHGTAAAGIIAAAQNGKGVMGIAPRVTLGAANFLEKQTELFASHGGAEWSAQADIFNASYGLDSLATPYEAGVADDIITAVRGMKSLRAGKGAIYVKSAGNSFEPEHCTFERKLPDDTWEPAGAYYDCSNPANDASTLEPNTIVVAALNAMGLASSYSSAGPVVWITGMGGEYGSEGSHGQEGAPKNGPTLFSTDIRGCAHGYSMTGADTPFLRGQTERDGVPENPDCDYAYMNGTSAAAPTISGVVALMLSANPELSWRDVRDILRLSARKVDPDYLLHVPLYGIAPYGGMMDLTENEPDPAAPPGGPDDIVDGATRIPMNLGWQKNAAGLEHSDWYGFGVPDAEKAVELARAYRDDPSRSRRVDVRKPNFAKVAYWQRDPIDPADYPGYAQRREGPFPYERVTRIGTFKAGAATVDQFQLRLTGTGVCLGSLGIAVRSPSGTMSLLKMPVDGFKADGLSDFDRYGLGSYAFHGEPAQGDWEIFALAADPDKLARVADRIGDRLVPRWSKPCPSKLDEGSGLVDRDFEFAVEARVIAQ